MNATDDNDNNNEKNRHHIAWPHSHFIIAAVVVETGDENKKRFFLLFISNKIVMVSYKPIKIPSTKFLLSHYTLFQLPMHQAQCGRAKKTFFERNL